MTSLTGKEYNKKRCFIIKNFSHKLFHESSCKCIYAFFFNLVSGSQWWSRLFQYFAPLGMRKDKYKLPASFTLLDLEVLSWFLRNVTYFFLTISDITNSITKIPSQTSNKQDCLGCCMLNSECVNHTYWTHVPSLFTLTSWSLRPSSSDALLDLIFSSIFASSRLGLLVAL